MQIGMQLMNRKENRGRHSVKKWDEHILMEILKNRIVVDFVIDGIANK